MQTTTAVSADVPAQTQHITKGRSLWIEEATRLHDANDHYCFRRPASKNTEVYGSGKRRGSTNHYAALKGGGSHSLPSMMTLLIAASHLLLDVLLLDALLEVDGFACAEMIEQPPVLVDVLAEYINRDPLHLLLVRA